MSAPNRQDARILSAHGVRKLFGGLAALDGVDLDVRRGQIHGLIGPNGSGKTTMLNVLSGVLIRDEGNIRFSDRDIAGLTAHKIARAGVARTFQNIRLFKKLSVLDNIKIGAHRHAGYGLGSVVLRMHRAAERRMKERAEAILAFVGQTHRRDVLAGTLSYGEQRLVEIGRALASEPELLLLDEPLAGMPPAEMNRAVELFRDIVAHGTTILLVEHTMRVVMSLCDEITVLNFGRRIAQGTAEEIRNHEDVIEAYLGKSARRPAPLEG